jgi:hypothetical protein
MSLTIIACSAVSCIDHQKDNVRARLNKSDGVKANYSDIIWSVDGERLESARVLSFFIQDIPILLVSGKVDRGRLVTSKFGPMYIAGSIDDKPDNYEYIITKEQKLAMMNYVKQVQINGDDYYGIGRCKKGNEGRASVILEAYPIELLRLIGLIHSAERDAALILSPYGHVYNITIGDYLGRNHGQVVSIDKDSILLIEKTCYEDEISERHAAIVLDTLW